jgi:hypothetical protein
VGKCGIFVLKLEHLFLGLWPVGSAVENAGVLCIYLCQSVYAGDALDLDWVGVFCFGCFAVRRAPVTRNTSGGYVVVNVYNLVNSVGGRVRVVLAN